MGEAALLTRKNYEYYEKEEEKKKEKTEEEIYMAIYGQCKG